MSRIALAYAGHYTAPYVRPKAVHAELERRLKSYGAVLMTGEAPRSGVTRTLFHLRDDIRQMQFAGSTRETVAVDLFPTRHMKLAELLVLVRNAVVEAVDNATEFENVEAYFREFDICWAIWRELAKGGQTSVVEVRPSRRRRLERTLGKKIFVLASGGLFEALDLVKTLAQVGGIAAKAANTAFETGSEHWYEKRAAVLGDYFARHVAPKLRPRLRAILQDQVRPSHLATVMIGLLSEAIFEAQRNALDDGQHLAFTIDAIDELDADGWEAVRLRAAICELVINGANAKVASVLGGRGPSHTWRRDLAGLDLQDVCLGPYEAQQVKQSWKHDLDEVVIQEILAIAYRSSLAATGGQLHEAWVEVMEKRGLA